MSTPLFFSVVVPTCKRGPMLLNCLQRLLPDSQVLVAADWEIIVSDDDPARSARPLVKSLPTRVHYAEGPSRGPAANRNAGARLARGQWLVFIDDDCLPDPSLLQAYHEAIQNEPACQVCEGRIYAPRPAKAFNEKSPINEDGGAFWSCNIALRKDFYDSLGGFDEAFPFAANEDQDLFWRIQYTGTKVMFVRHAAVCHPWRQQKAFQDYQQRNDSFLLLLSKHPEKKTHYTRISMLKGVFVSMKHVTLPGLLRYRFNGLAYECARLLESFTFAVRYLFFRESMIRRVQRTMLK